MADSPQAQAAMQGRKENASLDDLSEATAIITNPTHFAIALKYEVGESKAPVIISKGRGKIAEKIIEKGKKLDIGTMQSPKLARALYYTCDIGEEIMSHNFVCGTSLVAHKCLNFLFEFVLISKSFYFFR